MGRRLIEGVILSCVAAAVAGLIAGQQKQTPQRVTVEVTIVAAGRNNVPVEDLTVKEITVKDNGKKQEILAFDKVSSGSAATSGNALLHYVALLDGTAGTYRDLPENRLEVLRAIREVSNADSVTLMMVVQRVKTVDPSLLRKFAAQMGEGLELPSARPSAYDWVFSEPVGLGYIFSRERMLGWGRLVSTQEVLREVASRFRGRPGRKILLWISPGFSTGTGEFSGELLSTEQVLNDADIAVYSIDSRFLLLDDTAVSPVHTLKELSSETGGLAFVSRRDVANCVREALYDTRTVYVLRYAVSDLQNDGRYHAIGLDTSRKDVKLRARKGYYAPSGK